MIDLCENRYVTCVRAPDRDARCSTPYLRHSTKRREVPHNLSTETRSPMRRALCIALLLPSVVLSTPKCEEGDLTAKFTTEQKEVMAALGAEWLKHAVFCDFGTYQVLTPSDPKSDVVVVLKKGRPFLAHEPGFGINLFQDFGKQKSVPYLSVQDWDHTGIFRRLDYVLVGNAGNVVGNVRDKAMTGEVSITRYKPQTDKKK
jgi:hypothetical protein